MEIMDTKAQDKTYPLYERFSFGPGQRQASKSGYTVQLARGANLALIKNGWNID